jgi:hypothetical protein
MSASTSKPPAARKPRTSDNRRLGPWITASPGLALAAVFVYAVADHFAEGSNFGSVLAVGVAAGSAGLISGVLFGFLFGLPRTRQERPDATGLLTTNTNLDQISDWLTKILVGLGLVQLGRLSHGVGKLASSLAPGLGGGSGAKAFATALLIYAAIDGFLMGYLWARIVLSRRFRLAAQDLEVAAAKRTLQTLPSQLALDPKVIAESSARSASPSAGGLPAEKNLTIEGGDDDEEASSDDS